MATATKTNSFPVKKFSTDYTKRKSIAYDDNNIVERGERIDWPLVAQQLAQGLAVQVNWDYENRDRIWRTGTQRLKTKGHWPQDQLMVRSESTEDGTVFWLQYINSTPEFVQNINASPNYTKTAKAGPKGKGYKGKGKGKSK